MPYGDFNSQMATARAQYVGGGMRSDSTQPNKKIDYGDPSQTIPLYQGFASQGVQALGEQSAGDFRKELGGYLGGLNSIGALRSGAVESGANDIMNTYSRNFANAASQATLSAIGYGAQRVGQQLDLADAAANRKAQNRASTIGAVGGLLGAGVGLFTGKIGGGKK